MKIKFPIKTLFPDIGGVLLSKGAIIMPDLARPRITVPLGTAK